MNWSIIERNQIKYNKKNHCFKMSASKCWEINQVTSKCQTDFLGKSCKERSKKVNITIGFYIFEIV